MLKSLVNELRRRNVFRVAFVYLIAGWVIMQIADVMFPALNVPPWATSLLAAFLLLGLPIALILAWAFEITPEGLKRETDVVRDESITPVTARRIDYIIIGLLAVGLVYALYLREPEQAPATSVAETGPPSIAVLPFANLSADVENKYFSDGLSEELLNLLAKIDGLRVAARTSSFSFADSNETIDHIAEQLGVNTILEGSVRKSGDRIRVTAQLINASDGFHMWSESYDRQLDDIFAIQDDIAGAVAEALRLELVGAAESAVASTVPATESIDAYELYLKARHELNERTEGFLGRGEGYLREAIELAPDFAPAYATLGFMQVWGGEFGSLSVQEATRLAEPTVEKALELDPDLSDAYLALAVLRQYQGYLGDALEAARKSVELNPNSLLGRDQYANLLLRMGSFTEAIEVRRETVELDPLSPYVQFQLASSLGEAGYTQEADTMFEELFEKHAEDPRYYDNSASYFRSWHRDTEAADGFATVYELRPDDSWGPGLLATSLFHAGAPDIGEMWLERTRIISPESPYVRNAERIRNYAAGDIEREIRMAREVLRREPDVADRHARLAWALLVAGDLAGAQSSFEKELDLVGWETGMPLDNRMLDDVLALAFVESQIGDPESARQLAESVTPQLDKMSIEKRRMLPRDYIHHVRYHAVSGDRIAAMYHLQKAVDAGWCHPVLLRLDPQLDGIRDMPEFDTVFAQVEECSARQRELLLANPRVTGQSTEVQASAEN